MLAASFVILRFSHFMALMLLLGCGLAAAWLAPGQFQPVLARRLQCYWQPAGIWALISAMLLWALQSGLMGNGWADVLNPVTWQALSGTRFGGIWIWQMMLALITCAVVLIHPRRLAPLLSIFGSALLITLGWTGHSAMHEGVLGVIARINYALHLLSAAWWAGGLLPLLVCMQLAARLRWRESAIVAMMRFSRYGHLAVALVILTGVANTLLIVGWPLPFDSHYLQLLLIKVGLVAMMTLIALFNRYVLVPRFNRQNTGAVGAFVAMTWIEVILAAGVLGLVSLFATWEPF